MFLCLFEAFRRDLNRSEGGLRFKYHLVCRLVDMTLQLGLEFLFKSRPSLNG